MHERHFPYRPDIDGLRAIAVMAVIAFHAFPDAIPGGFVGVDIFFVISGFLISGILLREIASSTFSIRAFYARRVKRLFPALLIVLAATLGAGWFLLLEDEYRKLGWHASAAAGFFSNIALWAESGYFDGDGDLKPLRHLWSLGIEEQFYLIWPLAIAVLIRLRIHFIAMAATLLLLSFCANIAYVDAYPATTFFLPHTRFWELLMGGILAAVLSSPRDMPEKPRRRLPAALREAAAPLGLILIAIAVMKTPESAFPGWWALPPALGAILLIGAGPQTWTSRRLMSHRAMVKIGLISYPLYLWHWPMMSFARIAHADTPPITLRTSLTAAAFILAWATHDLVEQPLRRMAKNPGRSRMIVALLGASMLAVFGAGIIIHKGLVQERLRELSAVLTAARRDWKYPGDRKAFTQGSLPGTTLFLGDSYIQQFYPRIAHLAEQGVPHRTVMFHTSAGCAPLPGVSRKSNPQCAGHVAQGFSLAADPDTRAVAIGGSWLGAIYRKDCYEAGDPGERLIDLRDPATLDLTLARLEQELANLKSLGKDVFLILHPPGGGWADPGKMEMEGRLRIGRKPEVKSITMEEHLKRTGTINSRLRDIAQRLDIHVIDPADWICIDGTCFFTDPDGTPRFKDVTHFRASFIRDAATALDPLIIPQ